MEDGPSADSGGSGTTSAATEPGTTTEPGVTTTTEPGTTADSGTGPGTLPCGELECTGAEWCDSTDDVCGVGGDFGMSSCEPRPEGCGEDYAPVCGCDGQVHSNQCSASMAGVDVDAEGECPAPEGYFRCGYRFCDAAFQYCQVQGSDIAGFGNGYACMTPAMECMGGITCECLMEEFCFEFGCNPTADGGVEIVCPGG